MDRKEFISMMGIGAVAALTASELTSCSINNAPGLNGTDFTLLLTDVGNASLKNPGGYMIKNGIIVAHTLNGQYIAVSAACTHQGATVNYQASYNRFHCPAHGSNFSSTGAVINGPAGSPLTKLNTVLTGESLRVYL